MIGKIPNKRRDGKSSFQDLVSYCTEKDPTKILHVRYQNVISKETAAIEMEALATDNTRCKDPVFHAILAWREMEIPTNEQVDKAVQIALKELDLQGCQALWSLQSDTQNRHVHIVVNRIDPETGKAIIPANGWTYKALERAARKIELAQGWESEQSGFYSVTDDGKIIEKSKREKPAISTSAKDGEAHTAIKSAERIAQEVAAPILNSAKSWGELHEKLAEHGISFEAKGSGAVLHIGKVIIKASKASRDTSMSKLTARLGDYISRPEGTVIADRKTEPVERASKDSVKSDWERFVTERETYFQDKKEGKTYLIKRHKEERSRLQTQQKAERNGALAGSWKGRGAILNRTRSLMAAKQQIEKLNLADRQKKELDEFKRKYPHCFVNFKTWLEQEKDQKAFLSFRYPAQRTIHGNETLTDKATINADLRAFTLKIGNKGGVAYSRTNAKEADFIDYGRKIILSDKCDEAAILAALQLANQKWGGAIINGTDEYKRKCVEIAAKHRLKISNPELAIKASKTSQEKDEKKRIFSQYDDAVGAERFRITVTEFTENGTRAFIHDKQNGGYEGKTRDEILEAIPKFSIYTHYKKNIIVTPMSRDKHHILIDDLTSEKLKQFKDDGYSPACVIESSPENYQVIITVPSIEGDSQKDHEAANRITKELNLKYRDPKLSGLIHGHRLPPFGNYKPKHKRDDGTYPDTVLIEANEGICEKAKQELETVHHNTKATEQRMETEKQARQDTRTGIMAGTENRKQYMRSHNTGANDPNGAYWTHYRDIATKFIGAMDYSRIDAMIGVRMRATDYTQDAVESAIEENAPAMRRETMNEADFSAKYHNRDWRRYAIETTEKYVFGARGAVQFEKALDYRPLYMRLEGRNASKEQGVEYERVRQEKQSRGR
ncbi:hypothetical protein AGMMS49957_10890 [Synergistales bacterium]|nr:hypothetical protein AGMMS49957_10890 [Synergistales bacterium]